MYFLPWFCPPGYRLPECFPPLCCSPECFEPDVAGAEGPYVASVIKPGVPTEDLAPNGLASPWFCPSWYCSPECFSLLCCSLEMMVFYFICGAYCSSCH